MVRYIYNQIILESPMVRASAISALGEIGLKEKKLSDGLFWIEILAAIEPRSIRWDFVVKDNPSDKDKEMNAKYALSVARGLGALIFVVWEDITEVKNKLLLTFLASLYDVAQTREQKKD